MNQSEFAHISGQGGGFPPGGGGYGPPGGGPPGGYGPPGGAPPGGYGPPGGGPPGGYGPPGGAPPGGYGPPGGGPPGGYGPPGGGPFGPPGGYGPPGYPPPGGFAPPPGNQPPPGGGAFSAPGLDATDALSFAWNVISKDIGGVALPLAVGVFVMLLPSLVIGWGTGFTIGILQTTGALDAQTGLLINYGSQPIIAVISFACQGFMLGGIMSFALRVARGEKPDFGVVFSGGGTFVPMFGAAICYGLGSAIGFALCIVPGVIFALGGALYQQLVVDRRLGPIDAISESFRLTSGHRGTLFVYFFLMFCVSVLGVLACCVGSLLIAAPMHAVGMAYIYLKLTGEQPRPA